MYGRTNHCLYNINYHIVFCPKYRHKVIKDRIEDVVKQADKLKRLGVKLVKIEERGTSGTCPKCVVYTKQTMRIYRCGQCGFTGARRNVIGASGILDKSVNSNFTKGRRLPERVEYSWPKVLAIAA